MQLSFTIKKKSSNSLQGTRGFSFSGDYVLTDLGQNRVLSFSEFSKPVQNFSYEQDHKLRSAVATALYSIPLEQFVSVKSQLQSNNLKTNQFYLDVLNVGNINNLFKLERLLMSRGVTLQLSSSVSSLNQDKARLKISIVGDGEQLMKFLNSIHIKHSCIKYFSASSYRIRKITLLYSPGNGIKKLPPDIYRSSSCLKKYYVSPIICKNYFHQCIDITILLKNIHFLQI